MADFYTAGSVTIAVPAEWWDCNKEEWDLDPGSPARLLVDQIESDLQEASINGGWFLDQVEGPPDAAVAFLRREDEQIPGG